MQQILSVWSTLDTRRRIIVLGATLAMFAAVLGLLRMAAQPSMSLLYAGLEPATAGEVVAALEQQGVTYDVRDGAIFVASGNRDALRMTLAAEGLPANNGQGYELLDSLSGFGTTSQMFDAAYWRAKEGELARTIVASPQIKGARVHISNPSSNPFQRNLKATASVTVTTMSGGLPASHANALKFLVASAVAGLSPEDVSVIDGRGGLVVSGDDAETGSVNGQDRAAELRRNIQHILEARVGYGNAVVEVSVETVTEREAIVEHRFDPENRVAISSETEERSTTSSGSQNGSVTVASNLPEGDAGGGENSSRSENRETRERVNYEVSETTRELLRTPGAIKRISVAVLVDGLRSIDDATGQEVWAPRPEEEMQALQELVASAVGFDADRGDAITLKTMEFEPLDAEVDTVSPTFLQGLNLDAMSLLQLSVLALVALVLGLFVVRPILAKTPAVSTPALAGPRANPPMGLPGGTGRTAAGQAVADTARNAARPGADPRQIASENALTGEIDDGPGPIPGMAVISPGDMKTANTLPADAGEVKDPVERLRKLIEERKEETVEILRSWMEDHEETT
ncbi:MAG: flagellar M-ring protein FliF [Rhodobacter sp.]|nr:flagellar M-ring protein FliF [Rhodobacter sp.]